jgi:uncharacterized protein (TIGR02145 family)
MYATDLIYSVEPVEGVTYTWEVPTDWNILSGQGSSSITATASAVSGTISVTPSNTCGDGTAQTLAVTVNSVPDQPGAITASSINPCLNTSDLTYSIEAVDRATEYLWTLPNGWSITGGNNSKTITVTATSGAVAGNITVKAKNDCGSGAAQTLAVTVMPAPAAPTQSGTWVTTNVCAGTSAIYTVNSVDGATAYEWVVTGTGWVITPTNGTSATIKASTATGTIKVRAYNACQYSAIMEQAITIQAKPAAPTSISGSTSVCADSEQTYTAAEVAGATGYQWTVPSGWTITSATDGQTITVTVGTSPGNITVKAIEGCETSDALTLTVTASSKPGTPSKVILSKTSVEQYDTFTASVDAVSDATGYVWTVPNGLRLMSGGLNGIKILAEKDGTYNAGNITVAAKNSCGVSSSTSSDWKPFIVTPFTLQTDSIKDTEGNSYKIAKFGDAGWWMTQNLRSTKTVQGSTTKTLTEYDGTTAIGDVEQYYYPKLDPALFTAHPEYGLLYTWVAANIGVPATDRTVNPLNRQGICPSGWHLPTMDELKTLTEVIGTKAGGYSSPKTAAPGYQAASKLTSTTQVVGSTTYGTNGTSHPDAFNALLVGCVQPGNSGTGYGLITYFWTSSIYLPIGAVPYEMHFGSFDYSVQYDIAGKNQMYSVRCKKNE